MTEKPKAASQFLLSFWGLPCLLSISVLILDQATKFWVLKYWPVSGKIYQEVIPGFFSLVHFQNTGAAWGILSGHTWLLGLISCLALIAMIVFFRALTESRLLLSLCYGFLIGGIAGNLYDRLFRQFVVDFLFFYFRDYRYSWPAFNVADMAITCSVTVMVFYSLFFVKKTKSDSVSEVQ
ncbi:MAG: signal peptidase II [Lentisphaeria bacterium]